MLSLFRSLEYRLRHYERSRRTQIRALILLLPVLIVGISLLAEVTHDHGTLDVLEPAPSPVDKTAPSREPALPARTVFRHSVVPGGVLTADEVENAIGRDGIVAAHYSAINLRELRVETLSKDRAVYMSYRIGDKVFWTKHPVRVGQGETILTDGAHQIRTRCGNCIAFAPMSPTSDDEPGEMEFDALTGEPDVLPSHNPLGSELVLGPVGIPLLLLIGDSSGGSLDEFVGGGSSGMPVFGYAGNRTNPGLRGDQLSFPLFGDEPALDGFPAFVGPFAYPPQNPHDPANPEQLGGTDYPRGAGSLEGPEDVQNPIFPPLENPAVPVPEPATLLLIGSGLGALFVRRHRR